MPLATLAFLVLGASTAAPASAADRIYWSNLGASTIRAGNLDGTGIASTLFTEPGGAALRGIAANPAANRIYWASSVLGAGAIRVANLDGTGTASDLFADPVSFGPWGLAANPAANKVYWTNPFEKTIKVANLDGSGASSILFNLSDPMNPLLPFPRGVAIDPAANKIWWATQEFLPGSGGDSITFGNSDGSGTPTVRFPEGGGSALNGLAIYRSDVGDEIFWALTGGTGDLRRGNPDIGGASTFAIDPGSAPNDVAIDPTAGKIYWADAGAETIQVANLDGTGIAETLFTEAGGSDPGFLALVRAPVGSGAPVLSGGGPVARSPRSCSQGTWEPNLVGAHLYRDPASFAYQWQQDGTDIPGATGSSFTPPATGSYACRVTATNEAGFASQTSASFTVTVSVPGIYWSNGDADAIRVANLDGTGAAGTLFTEPDLTLPQGVAIDPAANKIYWADSAASVSTIRVANLDGSGTASNLFSELGTSSPFGVAIDPSANKIYWANAGTDSIRVGNLDGTGGPFGSNLFIEATGADPSGVAIDPAANKIYWADTGTDLIQVANLDGTATASPLFTEAGGSDPVGVAINPAANKIYWANSGTDQIQVANLDGTGSASPLFSELGSTDPHGVAIDPAANQIYWSITGTDQIRVANLDGTGSASPLFLEAAGSGPAFTALLRAPAGGGAPVVTGGAAVGQSLSCSQGSWAPNLLGAFLYQAPRSFAYQWQLNGADIAGATGTSHTPSSGGSYACRVTGSNLAGSGSQTSASVAVTGPNPPAAGPSPPAATNPAPQRCKKKKKRKKHSAAAAGKCKKKKKRR